ncbi:speriolin-like [Vombatus ursinus]|uniref:speriolin-like n=1 Tax=Vombatus ursinus TaxID=29139 RepID=UPI000FFCF240|nr:speriolin-like [Vombatus ursinus]
MISTDDNKRVMDWKPSADVEPSNMVFVGQPTQTSTPLGTMTIGTPITTFFGSPESLAQGNTSIPTTSSALASVPIAGTIPTSALPVTVATSSTHSTADATSLHQDAPPSSTPNLNATLCKDSSNKLQNSPARTALTSHASSLSPPHSSHSPPPHSIISSSPANHARRTHSLEHKNKSLLETERKTAHRKTGKVSETNREAKQLTCERLVGEIAFQLDRRILSSIFPERVRLYGFTVSNIPEKIIQASLNTSDHKLDEELCQMLTQRYVSVMNRLQSLGYNGRVHPGLTEQLVNAYGILRERPELAASEGDSYTMDFLQRVIIETVPQSVLTDALLLLSCLNQLSHDDGKPMFICLGAAFLHPGWPLQQRVGQPRAPELPALSGRGGTCLTEGEPRGRALVSTFSFHFPTSAAAVLQIQVRRGMCPRHLLPDPHAYPALALQSPCWSPLLNPLIGSTPCLCSPGSLVSPYHSSALQTPLDR